MKTHRTLGFSHLITTHPSQLSIPLQLPYEGFDYFVFNKGKGNVVDLVPDNQSNNFETDIEQNHHDILEIVSNDDLFQAVQEIYDTQKKILKLITIKHISIRMQRILKKTKIKKHATPHSFRHTNTSLMIGAGIHIKEIQERLRHSDIQTTMDIYAHMTKNMKKEASIKFTNLMENLSKNLL